MTHVIEITAEESPRPRPPRRPASGPDPRVGSVLDGRYRIVAAIAKGGMGVVYRGERLGLGRAVAIKFLHPEAAATPALRRRFETEARAASRMNHPNCVAVIDFGLERSGSAGPRSIAERCGDSIDVGAPYIVMDFVAGRTLAALLRDGPLSIARALDLGKQLLAGLAHAHAHGIIHRDIKPANVMVWSDAMGEHAQITDFGVAKILFDPSPADSEPRLHRGGASPESNRSASRRLDAPGSHSQNLAIGTPSYMSPEQTLGLPVDARSDVYGAGVLLYELLAERRPFQAGNTFDVMWLHREAPVPTFDEVAPHRVIPPAIEGVVRRALAKAPDDRYASAVQLVAALEAAAADAQESTDDEDLDSMLAAARSRPTWLKLLGFAMGLAAAYATWRYWPRWY